MRKTCGTLTILLAVLVICSIVSFQPATVTAQPKTIVVPDNYSTIQEAINNAVAGDTVFVKAGFYPNDFNNYGLIIDKPLTITGETPETTIIDANYLGGHYRLQAIISIESDDVSISGFTLNNFFKNVSMEQLEGRMYADDPRTFDIRASTTGILLDGYSNCKITQMIISECDTAISMYSGQHNIISENTIKDCHKGIGDTYAANDLISKNTFRNVSVAIDCLGSNFTIDNNIISEGRGGICLYSKESGFVHDNIIAKNVDYGLQFSMGCQNCLVFRNDFRNNNVGIKLENMSINEFVNAGLGNVVYANNFVDNAQNVLVDKHYFANSGTELSGIIAQVSWDTDVRGNYWSDYDGSGFYVINQDNIDHHPLAQPLDISPEMSMPNSFLTESWIQPLIIGVVIIVLFTISFLVYRWHRKISIPN